VNDCLVFCILSEYSVCFTYTPAKFVAVAILLGHRLRFHKVSSDGSGKCDAELTDDLVDRVIGVVFEISGGEKPDLNRTEGLRHGYVEKEVEIVTASGETTHAMMYFATRIDPSKKPYHWYKRHVLAGAWGNNLPAEYVAQIESVDAVDDPDKARCERELTIYR